MIKLHNRKISMTLELITENMVFDVDNEIKSFRKSLNILQMKRKTEKISNYVVFLLYVDDTNLILNDLMKI